MTAKEKKTAKEILEISYRGIVMDTYEFTKEELHQLIHSL